MYVYKVNNFCLNSTGINFKEIKRNKILAFYWKLSYSC